MVWEMLGGEGGGSPQQEVAGGSRCRHFQRHRMPGVQRQPLHGGFQHRDIPGAGDSWHHHRRENLFIPGYALNMRHDRSLYCLLSDLTDLLGLACHPHGWLPSVCSMHPLPPPAVSTLSCVVLVAYDCSSWSSRWTSRPPAPGGDAEEPSADD